MDFVTVDFETANEDLASICQVGLACFDSGELVDTFSTFINPEDDFSGINTAIHGITKNHVMDAPTFPSVYEQICRFFKDTVVVSHTHFDRSAWNKTIERYALRPVKIEWLDSARVVRRTWQERSQAGYGLADVCAGLGIDFKHHDALEDAKAAGRVLVKACEVTGTTVNEWLLRVEKPINPLSAAPIKRDGNINGPLYGETLVFTGALSMPRKEAADLAARAGCDVGTGVTKKTTLLVVGDQDIKKLKPGQKKSSKHIKAEQLIEAGFPIRVLQESDFIRVVRSE